MAGKNYSIMKFTVEVDEFWLDEESELAPALQNSIKNEVVQQIKLSVQTQVSNFMDKIMKEEIKGKLDAIVTDLMRDFLAKGTVKGSYSSDPEMTLTDWIKKQVTSQNSTIQDWIKKSVEAQVKDLKVRYDLLFATQIVSKINEQGMLKEDIAKLLLPS
jgi:hypothetical protein